MTTTGIASVAAGASAPVAGGTGPRALGKDDFLRLLVTQLRYQDPLSPLDQNQFLAQTAQFTALEELQNIARGLDDLQAASAGASLAQGAALVGRTVRLRQRDFAWDGRAPLALSFSVEGGTDAVTVQVLDAAGTVRRELVTTGAAGSRSVVWDGADGAGALLAPGRYAYRVVATGARPGAAAALEGPVSGLALDGGTVRYRIGDTWARPEDIVDLR